MTKDGRRGDLAYTVSMNEWNPEETTVPDFGALLPDTVIDLVEQALGCRCTNLCRAMNSYINRVYEVALADGRHVIAKFYRPGRWTRAALQDELDFLAELHEAEVPVVPPMPSPDGTLLHEWSGIWFAIFLKKGGRPLDGLTKEDWTQVGRLIGRMHHVGAEREAKARIHLHPQHSTLEHLTYILESGHLTGPFRAAYERAVHTLVDRVTPLFEDVETLRIHADCHVANILHRPGEGYHLLDFDDLSMGPAVQDLWLLLPERLVNARAEMDSLLDGYEVFWSFPYETLRLIEPLRAMRYIHYTAWCARQKADGVFSRLAADWGTPAFWRQEVADLETQQQEIENALLS